LYLHPRYLKKSDWWLTGAVAATLGVGLVVLSSAVLLFGPATAKSLMIKQCTAIVLGLAAGTALSLLDYAELRGMYWFLYGINIFLLLLVLLVGTEVNGSKSWIDFKYFSVQPSEISKVLLVITLSRLLERQERLQAWLDLIPPVLHVLPILVLVMLQGDLGTSLVIAAVSVILVYAAGFPGQKVLAALLVCAMGVAGLVYSHYHFGVNFPLQEHHWERIHTFLYPESDPGGAGYQVMRSKVSIGSGGLTGQGYRQGALHQLGYLPFHHTDFIFAVLVEEFGFVGGIAVIGLFGLILYRISNVAQMARDQYGALLAVGVGAIIATHVLENIGMTMGVTPVTGIPLPFMSYGPSALVSCLLAIGLVQSVAIHRDALSF